VKVMPPDYRGFAEGHRLAVAEGSSRDEAVIWPHPPFFLRSPEHGEHISEGSSNFGREAAPPLRPPFPSSCATGRKVYEALPVESAREQGARCNGLRPFPFWPTRFAPLGNLIPEWNDLL